jgi:hypothetical protein
MTGFNSSIGGAVGAAAPQISGGVLSSTQSSITTTMSLEGLSGLIFTLLIVMIGIGILIYGLSALERYKRLWTAIEWYARTLIYTAYGFVLCGVVGGIYLICNSVASAAGSIDPLIIVYVVGGYIGVTVLGYVGVLAYRKLRERHAEMKGTEQPRLLDSL